MTAVAPGQGNAVLTEADYIDGPAGKLFVTRFRPRTEAYTRHAVLCLPPFAEEMNKSRRMIALQGRRLAEHGRIFVIPDVLGTGDSEGEFGDAPWDSWCRDVSAVVDWLGAQGVDQIDVLAVRSGVYLGGNLLPMSTSAPAKIALWSPVVRCSGMLDQLFRTVLIRNAGGGKSTSVAGIRENLVRAGEMEIAGYRLSEPLLRSIDALEISAVNLAPDSRILWADVSPAMLERPPRRTEKILKSWETEHTSVEYTRISGPQFWMAPEIEIVPELLEKTTEFFTVD